MKKLSIYVDESGDFGNYSSTDNFYIFTLLFYEEQEINNLYIDSLKRELSLLDYGSLLFHGGPLIRNEKNFIDIKIEKRRKIFNKMAYFATHLIYEYKTFIANRKIFYSEDLLSYILSKQLFNFLTENISYFSQFDMIVYYDNGQKQLTKILKDTLHSVLGNVIFQNLVANDSYLLQLADYLTTLELTEQKYINKLVSLSEIYFFGSHTNFKKKYYRQIENKKFVNRQ